VVHKAKASSKNKSARAKTARTAKTAAAHGAKSVTHLAQAESGKSASQPELDAASVTSALAEQDPLEATLRSLSPAIEESALADALAGVAAQDEAINAEPQVETAAPAPAQGHARGIVPKVRHRVVEAALSWIGTRYRFGGDTPAGFDCSGLVHFVFRETVGMDLPRVARDQRRSGQEVAKDELKPGDLVFFNTIRRDPSSHVGIYIGNDKFLHAPSRGSLVRIDTLHSSYWAHRFTGARRLITGKTLAVLPSALTALEN
jgi:cell wall-associated NlpC family hydrolase